MVDSTQDTLDTSSTQFFSALTVSRGQSSTVNTTSQVSFLIISKHTNLFASHKGLNCPHSGSCCLASIMLHSTDWPNMATVMT